MSSFRFPRVHITRRFEKDGLVFDEAVTSPVCDFCFDQRVKWDYDCERFLLDNGFASDGGFAACDVCSGFIEDKAWLPLIKRILASWKEMGGKTGQAAADDACEIVKGFLTHYVPGRKAFG